MLTDNNIAIIPKLFLQFLDHYFRVYCKYHYDTAHEFSSSEEELRHFLEMLDSGKGFQCSPVRHLIPPEQMSK
jgi:hypothetical protein